MKLRMGEKAPTWLPATDAHFGPFFEKLSAISIGLEQTPGGSYG